MQTMESAGNCVCCGGSVWARGSSFQHVVQEQLSCHPGEDRRDSSHPSRAGRGMPWKTLMRNYYAEQVVGRVNDQNELRCKNTMFLFNQSEGTEQHSEIMRE